MARTLLEGSCALAEAAIQAGCRFYAGYPITPSTEILEYMAVRMPQVGGTCMNAESEIEAIGMVWGAAGCGVRSMTASTGQGISLMQESFAELANAQIPVVVVNMCRGQGDYFQSTRGGGHGDYRFIVLAPASAQEAVDLAQLAFHLSEKWRNPVMVMGDFLLSHTSEIVEFRAPSFPKLPPKSWAITGANGRRGITLWPFPSQCIATAAERAKAVAVFELNAGQMIEDVQLAVLGRAPVHAIGGISHDHSGFGVGPLLNVEHILKRIEDVYPTNGRAA